MQKLLLIALSSVAAIRLQRTSPPPRVPGFACIPVPIERLVAPGQREMMHVYDASSLAVLRHAQAYSNLTYGQVVIDAAAARERRFAVEEIGSRVRVVSMAPSQHVARDGTTSSSMMCEVLGIGLLTVGEVVWRSSRQGAQRSALSLVKPASAGAKQNAIHDGRVRRGRLPAQRRPAAGGVGAFAGDLVRSARCVGR